LNRGDTPNPQDKSSMQGKKIMLSVWWDREGVIYFELLPFNQTITAVYYSEQLERLGNALREKRPHLFENRRIIIQQDNARPHTASITKKSLRS
jgi:Transposase (partial DDE domain)